MKQIVHFFAMAIAVILITFELIAEYSIKTLMYIPWFIIKRESIYKYPPLLFYASDESLKWIIED